MSNNRLPAIIQHYLSSVISRPTPLFFLFMSNCWTDVDSDGIWVRKQDSILWHSRDSNVASTIRLPFISFCFLLLYVILRKIFITKDYLPWWSWNLKSFQNSSRILLPFVGYLQGRRDSTLEFFPSLEFVILSLCLWRINIFLNKYIFQMFKYEVVF